MTPVVEWSSKDLPSSLLVLAPHPDDDVLGCGLLMRRVAAAGGRIVTVWLTDGGCSHGELGAKARRSLVQRRKAEALAGLRGLGVTPEATYFLDFPDGALQDHVDQALECLRTICGAHKIDTLVVTDGQDGHADHRAAFAIAKGLPVQHLYSYPISTRYDGQAYSPPDGVVCIVQESGDFKRAALACHRSQTEDGALYPLSAATVDRFCAEPELFIPIRISVR